MKLAMKAQLFDGMLRAQLERIRNARFSFIERNSAPPLYFCFRVADHWMLATFFDYTVDYVATFDVLVSSCSSCSRVFPLVSGTRSCTNKNPAMQIPA